MNFSDETAARIYHLANDSWTMAPIRKPGSHRYAKCGKAKDVEGKEVVILSGSVASTKDSKASYILDIEVIDGPGITLL